MVPIELQNRHGKSSEAVANDTEDMPEDSSARGYNLNLNFCEKKI